MTRILKDPLLDIARVIVMFLMGIVVILAGGVAIGIVAVAVKSGQLLAQLGSAEAFWALLVLLAGVAIVAVLGFLFLRHLKRIIDLVGQGDPFVPENATSLTAMAWLMLALQVAALFLQPLSNYVTAAFGEGHTAGDFGYDGNGLILVLTLFILARVFRKGTAMREDLEGTV